MFKATTISYFAIVTFLILYPCGVFGYEIDYPDFSNLSTWTLNGDAQGATDLGHSCLGITRAQSSELSSAYLSDRVPFTADYSFSTGFSFRIHDPGPTTAADGFTFVIQNDPRGLSALGSGGGDLGYGGKGNTGPELITPSFAVEFDTFPWLAWDPNGNHIGVNLNGHLDSLTTATPPTDLANGQMKYCWIDYDGASDRAKVFFSEEDLKPQTPIIDYTVDLSSVFNGQKDLYVGFTGATGGETSAQDVHRWSLSTTAIVPEPSGTMLLGLGIAGLLAFGWRQRSRR
jgi:hypothetical protein